jgi:hypothetical protein
METVTPDNIMRIAQTLIEPLNTTLLFYHGTSSASLEAILQEGLIPARSKGALAWVVRNHAALLRAGRLSPSDDLHEGEASRSVFVTTNLVMAGLFAQLAASMSGGKPAILNVRVPGSMLSRFAPDHAWEGVEGFRFEGTVPREWVSVR